MKASTKFAALFFICISFAVAGQSYALDIGTGQGTSPSGGLGDTTGLGIGTGVSQGQQNNTGLINQGVNGNNAASGLGGAESNGESSSAVAALKDICNVSVVKQDGQLQVFSVGVNCFENIVNGLAEDTIVNFSGYLSDIVYTLLVLYLILYGARVSMGMHVGDRAKSEFAIHALKVAFVAWLIFNFGLLEVYNMVLSSYKSLIIIVMDGANLGTCSGQATFSTGNTDEIWNTMDCMLTKFVGWETQNGFNTTYKNVPLFLGIIFSKLAPANGFIIGGILFSALWALLSGFFRLAFVYILSLIALILLFSIAPMIIPLMLFKKTYNYFEGWLKLVISMILQPVILFAFFAFIASLMTKTIEKMQVLYKQMKGMMQTAGSTTTGDKTQFDSVYDAFGNLAKNMDGEMLLNGVTTFIIAFLMISFINYVSSMALELAGHGTAPNLGTTSSEMFSMGI